VRGKGNACPCGQAEQVIEWCKGKIVKYYMAQNEYLLNNLLIYRQLFPKEKYV